MFILSLRQDDSHLTDCDHMLLYLTADTWSITQSQALAAEVNNALDLGVHVLLAHEMHGMDDQDARSGCEFGLFFSNTPPELLHRGIYSEIAVALKGGEWREASMCLLHAALMHEDKDGVQRSQNATHKAISARPSSPLLSNRAVKRAWPRMSLSIHSSSAKESPASPDKDPADVPDSGESTTKSSRCIEEPTALRRSASILKPSESMVACREELTMISHAIGKRVDRCLQMQSKTPPRPQITAPPTVEAVKAANTVRRASVLSVPVSAAPQAVTAPSSAASLAAASAKGIDPAMALATVTDFVFNEAAPIGVGMADEGDKILIREILKGSVAHVQGVELGSEVLAVNGESVVGVGAATAKARIAADGRPLVLRLRALMPQTQGTDFPAPAAMLQDRDAQSEADARLDTIEGDSVQHLIQERVERSRRARCHPVSTSPATCGSPSPPPFARPSRTPLPRPPRRPPRSPREENNADDDFDDDARV